MILARCLKVSAKPITVELETKHGVRSVERARFGLHLVLGDLLGQLDKAIEDGESLAAWNIIERYFELAAGFEVIQLETFDQLAHGLLMLWTLNSLFFPPPFLRKTPPSAVDQTSLPWDYEGRASILMVHMLARAYGWKVEEIVDLEPEVGLALINEVLVDEQLHQEWEYGLSEVARVYNPSTKRSHFKPLPRPHWMLRDVANLQTKILKAVLPQGRVLDVEGKEIN